VRWVETNSVGELVEFPKTLVVVDVLGCVHALDGLLGNIH